MPRGIYVRKLKPLSVRLLRHAVRKGECLIWTGAKSTIIHPGESGKYGAIGDGEGTTIGAHRAAYLTWVGPIPDGMLVLHKCDNGLCIEPSHLFTGTRKDNSDDMVAKGRSTFGARNPQAKLTEAAVRRIRQLKAAGLSLSQIHGRISGRYKVSLAAIGLAAQRATWRHVE